MARHTWSATGKLPATQLRFQQRVGEPGYTISMITTMLSVAGLPWYGSETRSARIRRFAEKNGLLLDLRDLEIKPKGQGAKAMVPQSKLRTILDELDIPATLDDLRDAAMTLSLAW